MAARQTLRHLVLVFAVLLGKIGEIEDGGGIKAGIIADEVPVFFIA